MPNLENEVATLRRIPLFANIDPSKLKLLAFTSQRVSFDPEQDLVRQGEDAEDAFVIVDGKADVVVTVDGGEIVVASLREDALVGEIAILCDTPRTATIRARTPLVALRIAKDQLLTMIKEFPDMSLEMMRVLATRLSKTTAELTEARNKLGS